MSELDAQTVTGDAGTPIYDQLVRDRNQRFWLTAPLRTRAEWDRSAREPALQSPVVSSRHLPRPGWGN